MQGTNDPVVVSPVTPAKVIRSSVIYFVSFAALAAVAPYLVLYFESLGFNGQQIGLLLSLGPLIGLVAVPFWTGLADATGRHRLILMGGMTVAIIVYGLVPFLNSYGLIMVAVFTVAALSSQNYPLMDSATVHMLGDQKDRYGRIRLWGTIGWGVMVAIVGWWLDTNPLHTIFWIYSGMTLLNLLLVTNLQFEKKSESIPYFQNVRSLLRNRAWILFLVTAFLASMGMAPHGTYLSLLLQDMGTAPSILGITIMLSTIAEAPVMFFSTNLIRRFGSNGLLLTAMAVIGLRNVLYAFATDPWQVMALQALHGFTFPAMWIAGVNFAAEAAPKGLNATAQGMFGVVLMGFGSAAGNLVSGVLIDQVGLDGMFLSAGSVALVTLVFMLFIGRRVLANAKTAVSKA